MPGVCQTAYCRKVLGCHPHPSCPGKALGFVVVLFKACGCGQGLCALNRQYNVGPACDSLNQRARACYLLCNLCKMNFVMPLAYAYSQFPPPHIERALHLVNQGSHHSGAKNDVLYSLIDFRAGPET